MSKKRNGYQPKQEDILAEIQRLVEPQAKSALESVSLNPIPQLILKVPLNDLFSQHIENVRDCLLFLESYTTKDEKLNKLLKIYKEKHIHLNSENLDLDQLVADSGITPGEFRRMIWSAADMMQDEHILALIIRSKPHLIETSIQIALTPDHPDSYLERKRLLEYLGYSPLNKNVVPAPTVNVNVNQSQNQVQTSGLPSFSDTIINTEKLINNGMIDIKNQVEKKQLPQGNVVDIQSMEIIEVKENG